MILHDGKGDHIDRERLSEPLESIDDPLASYWRADEGLTPHAPGNAVIDTRGVRIDDVATRNGHAAKLARKDEISAERTCFRSSGGR